MAVQDFTITSSADLAAAIAAIDQTGADAATNTAYTFTFTASVTLTQQLDAINLDTGSSLTIVGDAKVLSGAGRYNGLFVYGGAVTVDNLTISDTVATGGVGGNGLYGGGGGAGLGGGLFVGAGGDVTLQNVAFETDSAVGGDGNRAGGMYSGGGGGLDGGAGGAGSGSYNDDPNYHYQDKGIIDGGGGGGVGLSATGGSGQDGAGAPGIIPGAAAGQAGYGQDGVGNAGPNGRGGASAGGGGAGSDVGAGGTGGAGGFGGGGGGGFGQHYYSDQGLKDAGGGSGGFGGGGGGVGGSGGFGGGGGGGYLSYTIPGGKGGGGGGTATYDGAGGFGGGNGGGQTTGSGGGGLGAGGDVFVQQGGTLTIDGGTLGAGTATGGAAAAGGTAGDGFGSGLFIQGNQSVTLNAAPGQTLRLDGVIADEHGSISTDTNAGALDLGGGGTVLIDPATPNTYSGGTTVTNGTTVLYYKDGALGSGPLAQQDASELIVGSTSFSVSTSVLDGPQDYVSLPYAQRSDVSLGSVPGYVFEDANGGTELIPQTITVTDDLGLSAAITEIDAATKQMLADGMTGSFTIDLANNITLGRQLPAIDIAAGSSLTIDGGGATLSGNSTYQGFVVSAGTVAVDDITISRALAQGGAGSGGGGGGAGLGGGVFVGADAAVTLTNTIFAGVDEAAGGAGSSSTAGGPGGGLNGGPAGSVGFGDGGVGRPFVSGDANNGGNGGFGGGGGQGGPEGQPGAGGFGAGNGAPASDYGGGGGLGAGGDVFVQQGGSLTVQDSTLNLGSVAGGGGGTSAAGSGDAFGSGLFIQGHDSVTLDALAGQTVAVAGVIADEHGSIASDPAEGSLLIDGPGDVVLSAHNTFTGGTQLDDGTLSLAGNGTAGGGPITFGGDALLQFFAINPPTTTPIMNFRVGDTIEIEGFTETSDGYSSPTLTLHGNHPEVMLDIPGLDLADLVVTDSGGNTFLTLTNPPCYCRGTRIATSDGEVAVESLAVGDRLVTAAGLLRPVVWVGRRRLDLQGRAQSAPIVIAVGALAPGVPHRELWVSPDHGMALDGHLVPARLLVNGVTIRRAPACGTVDYFHVELDEHDIILAEGAAAESWLDAGNRAMFENAPVALLRADLAQERVGTGAAERAWGQRACAPLLQRSGPLLDAIRARLVALAGLPPDVVVTLDALGRHCINIPPGSLAVMLTSAVGCAPNDSRDLGIAINDVVLDGVRLAMDDPALALGFHPLESNADRACRWTDGRGRLEIGAADRPLLLEIEVVALPDLVLRPDALGWHCLTVPAGVAAVMLTSAVGCAPNDSRDLGVAITHVMLDGRRLTLDDPAFASGFHALEIDSVGAWRWTSGRGRLEIGAASRARTLEIEVTALPDIILTLDTPGWHRVSVPAGAPGVMLASTVAHAANDSRRLGVSIVDLTLDDVRLPLDHPALAAGFHAVESSADEVWRWTDGRGRLEIGVADRPRLLAIHVSTFPQPVPPEMPVQAPRRAAAGYAGVCRESIESAGRRHGRGNRG